MSHLPPEEVERIKENQRIRTSETIKTGVKIYLLVFGIVLMLAIVTCALILVNTSVLNLGVSLFSDLINRPSEYLRLSTQASNVQTIQTLLVTTKQALDTQIAYATPEQGYSEPKINLPTLTPKPNARIGIVAGHWSKDPKSNDPGAVCPNGKTEVEINQEIATKVQEILKAQGYDVDLLEEWDPRLTGYRALALVSIHADSCEFINDQATGFKVAAAMSTHNTEEAERLTTCLRNRYSTITGLPFLSGSITADMTSYHAFDEIDDATTAAIIELGFLNLDYRLLTTNPDLVARGVIDGILCYVRNEKVFP